MSVRIGIATAVWKRHELTRAVLSYYNTVGIEGVELVGVAAGTKEDESQPIVEGAGWHYVEAPNDPLSDKFNTAVQAFRDLDVDALVVIGSDDVLNGAYFECARRHIERGVEAWTQRGCYFHDLAAGVTYWAEKARPGAGRMFSRGVLSRNNYTLWPSGLNRHLDRAGHQQVVLRCTPWERTWHPEREGIILVDIKTDVNLWTFREVVERTGPLPQTEAGFLASAFPSLDLSGNGKELLRA